MQTDSTISIPGQAGSISPSRLWWRRFFIKLRSWEYWPMYVFNTPVIFIWLWNAIRSKNLCFFTLANPGIETGGLFGESKSGILDLIPAAYKPKTLLVSSSHSVEKILQRLRSENMEFPLMAKPEVGERGWLISKVHNANELEDYRSSHPIDFILQTYVDFPIEVSILVYRMPDARQSGVTSICEKRFLQVKGDGSSTLGELIMQQDRAVLQYEKLRDKFGYKWEDVLPANETMILEHVGNHCRGTMFLNRHEENDEQITTIMTGILASMPGMYYGRFDMRIGSWASLRAGKEIMVLEFNGVASEPAHIYQPGYSLWTAYKDVSMHWEIIRKIARQNRQLGHPPVTLKKLISGLILYFRYKRAN